MQKAVLKDFSLFMRKHLCWSQSLFKKVVGVQALRTPILKKPANGCLVHISVKNLTKVQLKCLFQNLRIGKVFAM